LVAHGGECRDRGCRDGGGDGIIVGGATTARGQDQGAHDHARLHPALALRAAPSLLPPGAGPWTPRSPPAAPSVGDSPEGPLKQPGKSCLKPAKNQTKDISLKHTHGARPTLRWSPRPTREAHSKAPSSRFCLARGFTPPSSGFRLARGFTPPPPRAGSASLEGSPPPRSRLPHAHARSRTRVRAFNALARQGGAIMRLGLTPWSCCTNSLGGTRHCGGLCDVAGVSPVTLRRLLPYG
jgi:hypothetical protein